MTRAVLLLLLGLLFSCISAPAQSAGALDRPTLVYLHVSAMPLREALARWNKKTGLSFGLEPGLDIENVAAPTLWGWFYPAEALDKLLAPAGLHAEQRSGTFFMVRPGPPDSNEPSDPSAGKLSEVQVTGSHIRDARFDFNPLYSYSRADIERSGAFTTDEFAEVFLPNFARINPQTTTGNGTNFITANNVSHGVGIDLYGFGPGATLALLDGQRIPLSGHDSSYVDISMIPLSHVDHVDILTDAASAIYGGDAIAGVVNFVLRRDFKGFETTPYFGVTTGGGGRELGFSQLAGNSWSQGSLLVSYENYHQQAIDAASRDNLVPVSGPYQVIPRQFRQSAALTAHQNLSSRVDVATMAYYSSRDFSQEYTTFPVLDTWSDGNSRVFGGTVTLSINLPAQWASSISTGFGGEKEKGTTTAASQTQSFNTHSDSYAADLRLGGPLFPLPAGPVRLSTGFSWRLETFNDVVSRLGPTGSGLERDVFGVYTEALVPLISDRNTLPWVKRLEWSAAVRWDEDANRDAGLLNAHAINPKTALLWSPGADLTFRGTFTPSAFRVAPLAQMGSINPALLYPFSNPDPNGKPINTLYLTGGNNTLQPEYARTYTFGLDWKPDRWPGWSFSGSYLHVHYRDRISIPPVIGPITGAFSQLATLAPYINMTPSAAEIQYDYAHYGVKDPTGIGQGAVEALFDGRYLNIGTLDAAGIETTTLGKIALPLGVLNLRLDTQYLTQLSNQATQTAAYVSVVRTVSNPPELRFRSEVWWSFEHWIAGLAADYTGSFRDTEADHTHIPPWLIFNARISYSIPEASYHSSDRKTTVSLTVNNLTDRDPHHLASIPGRTLNYDASNASPAGCQIRIELKQRW